MQHVLLGVTLQHSYSSFLANIESLDNLYVRSRKYDQTIQSAAAHFTAILLGIATNNWKVILQKHALSQNTDRFFL